MSGNDRRTALLGRLEKIRELLASFFRAFTRDEVHHACLRNNRTAPYRMGQYHRPPAHKKTAIMITGKGGPRPVLAGARGARRRDARRRRGHDDDARGYGFGAGLSDRAACRHDGSGRSLRRRLPVRTGARLSGQGMPQARRALGRRGDPASGRPPAAEPEGNGAARGDSRLDQLVASLRISMRRTAADTVISK